ncbi:transposase [Staphylococcus ureilyticus]
MIISINQNIQKLATSLDDGFEDAFQYTVQGNSHNRLKSTNLIEQLNQEVRKEKRLFTSSPIKHQPIA